MSRFADTARLGSLLDLIYPPECVWCQAIAEIGQRLCQKCRTRFASNYYRCLKCAAPLPVVLPNGDCSRCRQAKWRFTQVAALATYRGEMRRAVIMMKRKRFEPLRRAMCDLLAEQLFNVGAHDDLSPLLVPVPYHWTHSFSSSANTSELLAHGIARATRWPVERGIIRRIRKTQKQGMLSWAERKKNVRRAFAIQSPEKIQDKTIWLVDDVMTSGATVGELARLLLKSGAARVNVAVVARGTGVRESSKLDDAS